MSIVALSACGGSAGSNVPQGPSFADLDADAIRLYDEIITKTATGNRQIQRRGSATYDGVFYGQITGARVDDEFVRAATQISVEFDGARPRLRGTMTDFVGEETGDLAGTLRLRQTRSEIANSCNTRTGCTVFYETDLEGRIEVPGRSGRRQINASVIGAFWGNDGDLLNGNVTDRSGQQMLNGSLITER